MVRPNKKDYYNITDYIETLEEEKENLKIIVNAELEALMKLAKRINKFDDALEKACNELCVWFVGEDKTAEEWKAYFLNE